MPYVLRGKCVFKNEGGKLTKKGCSASVAEAKKYLQVLNMRHAGVQPLKTPPKRGKK